MEYKNGHFHEGNFVDDKFFEKWKIDDNIRYENGKVKEIWYEVE